MTSQIKLFKPKLSESIHIIRFYPESIRAFTSLSDIIQAYLSLSQPIQAQMILANFWNFDENEEQWSNCFKTSQLGLGVDSGSGVESNRATRLEKPSHDSTPFMTRL